MKKLAILLSLFFISNACSDFTEVNPKGVLNDATLSNVEGVNLLLAGAYSVLDGINAKGGNDWHVTGDNWWFDVLSDDAHKGSTNSDQADLFDLEVYNWATGNAYILNKWGALYSGVNRANAVISLAASITTEDLTAQIAEARFLRGYFNMELIKIYENVAYISEENYANQEFNQPNSGPIWSEVEADFTFAAANLPASQSDVGRINSWGAKAFLGKAQLFQDNFAGALTQFTDVINNGPYSLNAEYVDNFNAAGENGPESIFAIQFVADAGVSNNGNRGGTLNFPGGGPIGSCCGFYQPSQDLANAYQTSGGLPLLDTFNATDIANDAGINSDEPFTPHTGPLDPRIDYTVGRREIDYNGWGVNVGKDWIRASFNDISGPYLAKKNFYQNGEDSQRGTGGWGEQRSGINYNIMRYADVLLMAAEAQARGNTGDFGLAYVNEVRQRAIDMTTVKDVDGSGNDAANYDIALYAASDFANQADAIQRVKFERRLELAMEGHRFFDLVRWGDAEAVINAYAVNEARTIPTFTPNTFESKHNRLPIPLNAIDLSGGILQQNPGH
jgi:hypothetical protein